MNPAHCKPYKLHRMLHHGLVRHLYLPMVGAVPEWNEDTMMHAACRFKHVGALSEAAYGLYSVGTSSPQNKRTLLQYLTCKLPACLLLMLLPPLLSDYKGVRCVRELGAGPSRENELRLVNLDVAFTAGGPGFVRLSCCFQPCDLWFTSSAKLTSTW